MTVPAGDSSLTESPSTTAVAQPAGGRAAPSAGGDVVLCASCNQPTHGVEWRYWRDPSMGNCYAMHSRCLDRWPGGTPPAQAAEDRRVLADKSDDRLKRREILFTSGIWRDLDRV